MFNPNCNFTSVGITIYSSNTNILSDLIPTCKGHLSPILNTTLSNYLSLIIMFSDAKCFEVPFNE